MPERCGSSPHTRGAHRLHRPEGGQRRIIPAYAGSTTSPSRTGRRAGGSSPHTRGAPHMTRPAKQPERIIPAYAGSTGYFFLFGSCFSDHPRIRGEHDWKPDMIPGVSGSSPHTRGALDEIRIGDRGCGIIPAYAGSTFASICLRMRSPDHPRIRGEHCRRQAIVVTPPGSSPHTRGARCRCGRDRGAPRIIPAYAGSTSLARGGFGRPADHPRIRGEH